MRRINISSSWWTLCKWARVFSFFLSSLISGKKEKKISYAGRVQMFFFLGPGVVDYSFAYRGECFLLLLLGYYTSIFELFMLLLLLDVIDTVCQRLAIARFQRSDESPPPPVTRLFGSICWGAYFPSASPACVKLFITAKTFSGIISKQFTEQSSSDEITFRPRLIIDFSFFIIWIVIISDI